MLCQPRKCAPGAVLICSACSPAANPIAVMTQDTSRDFLSGSGEAADRKKYQLFMEVRFLHENNKFDQKLCCWSLEEARSERLNCAVPAAVK